MLRAAASARSCGSAFCRLVRRYVGATASSSSADHAAQRQRPETYGYSPADGDQTHFGSATVDRNEKQQRVAQVFHSVADSYDVMNDLMSGTVHRLWKDLFVRDLGPASFFPDSHAADVCFLDVAGGTGDIAFRICDEIASIRDSNRSARQQQRARVIVSDINPSMLGVGSDRWQKRQASRPELRPGGGAAVELSVDFLEASAESLPLPDGSVDAYTVSFGIRNVTNIDVALAEAYRVLKPGGRFMCLEFSKVVVPGLREVYDAYSATVIPVRACERAVERACVNAAVVGLVPLRALTVVVPFPGTVVVRTHTLSRMHGRTHARMHARTHARMHAYAMCCRPWGRRSPGTALRTSTWWRASATSPRRKGSPPWCATPASRR
jgi:ubiquinone/menaquinone biosynthesis methyltransferase